MSTIHSSLPIWACLVSLFAVIPIVLSRRHPNLRETFTFLAGFIKFGLVLAMLPIVLHGQTIEFTIWRILPNLAIEFRVDAFGMLFALVASSLWIITSVYSVGYMRSLKEHSQTRFFAFFAIALSATLGVAFSANLFTLYLFYEMLSLSTYPLVTHHQDKEARTGGRTYLTYLMGTSIGFVLPALIFCYIRTGGDMDFSAAGFLSGHLSGTEALVVLLLFIFGFAKSGLMPFHSWLPGAMVAPTPVSALLHAVAVVKVGVFCIVRVITGVFGIGFLQELGYGTIIAGIASFTVIVSSLIALTQDNLKRRLAFSTIGQLAYITLGVALLAPKGIMGSMMHIGMHAFGKITLFFCAGAIFVATGKKYVSEMAGIGKRMPITMFAFFIGSLSVIGLPPTGGFISKWYLVTGTVEADQIVFLIVFLASTLLNAAYFLPIVYSAFFKLPQGSQTPERYKEGPWFCVIPLGLTALVTLILFIKPQVFMSLANLANLVGQ
ncbi:MAG: monovalent cation/H+ antiporter subunit D family protein [Verrucomicrobia bacterium]|nr:MAG: monovalent cation/H+ antiporter subunit D family protein [Verrucomicrobiota bacterium]